MTIQHAIAAGLAGAAGVLLCLLLLHRWLSARLNRLMRSGGIGEIGAWVLTWLGQFIPTIPVPLDDGGLQRIPMQRLAQALRRQDAGGELPERPAPPEIPLMPLHDFGDAKAEASVLLHLLRENRADVAITEERTARLALFALRGNVALLSVVVLLHPNRANLAALCSAMVPLDRGEG